MGIDVTLSNNHNIRLAGEKNDISITTSSKIMQAQEYNWWQQLQFLVTHYALPLNIVFCNFMSNVQGSDQCKRSLVYSLKTSMLSKGTNLIYIS